MNEYTEQDVFCIYHMYYLALVHKDKGLLPDKWHKMSRRETTYVSQRLPLNGQRDIDSIRPFREHPKCTAAPSSAAFVVHPRILDCRMAFLRFRSSDSSVASNVLRLAEAAHSRSRLLRPVML